MLECGADGTIYKPYGPKELLETIHSQLEVKDKENGESKEGPCHR